MARHKAYKGAIDNRGQSLRFNTLAFALVCTIGLFACGTSPTDRLNQDLIVVLSGNTQAIADVDGPYGGVSMKEHAVAIRVWPDSMDDGLAEVSVFITNGSWNTVTASADDIIVTVGDQESEILGKEEMLARLAGAGATFTAKGFDGGGPSSDSERLTGAADSSGAAADSQKSGSSDGSTFNSGISEAAQRASSNRRPTSGSSDQSTEKKLAAIEDWYLDRIDVYPGDTGTGGISIPLPNQSESMQITVRLDGETYTFDLEYTRAR